MRSILGICLMLGLAGSALAQQGRPAPTPAPAARPDGRMDSKMDGKGEAKPAAPACERFAAAQTAVYAAYVRMIAGELPDPATTAGKPGGMAAALEGLYTGYVDKAKAGDVAAVRKAIALELFGMQLQSKPALEITMRKLCLMGKEPGRETLLETLGCAVTALDGPRREQPGNKETAKQMLAKAKASLPAEANAADTGRLLYDDVSKGLAGCT